MLNFLRGLSRDELECLAEFEGSCILDSLGNQKRNPYRLLADFFDFAPANRWANPDEKAHKTIVLLSYLDHLDTSKIRVAVGR